MAAVDRASCLEQEPLESLSKEKNSRNSERGKIDATVANRRDAFLRTLNNDTIERWCIDIPRFRMNNN